MIHIEQGDLLKVAGLKYPVMVVSIDFFNETGKAIACPIVKNAVEGRSIYVCRKALWRVLYSVDR